MPWWKREIGGGKKKGSEAAEIGAAGAVAAGAAAVAAGRNGTGEHKPGFFKRIFGGGKDEPQTEPIEAETTPASDVAGVRLFSPGNCLDAEEWEPALLPSRFHCQSGRSFALILLPPGRAAPERPVRPP